MHPLLALFLAAADGHFPEPDGAVEFVPGLDGGQQAIVAFTAHAVIATDTPHVLADTTLDGYGGALHPAVICRLAGDDVIGVLDVTLVARGRGGGALPRRTDAGDHPRVQYARRLRQDVRVHGDERGLITLATGLAGRHEMSIETAAPKTGRELIAAALELAPENEPLFAAVSPGNAQSLRAFLAAGFVPIGSELIISPSGR